MVKISIIAVILFVLSFGSAQAHSERVDRLPTAVIAKEAKKVVKNGGTYSVRHGDCSPYLKRLVYELVQRAFPTWSRGWALYVVERESGFCPGAVNTIYSAWDQQAKGLAQWVPDTQPEWINYKRLVGDPWYAVRVFVVTSNHGKKQGPWCLPCMG
jgi:hypothetical protein